MLFIVATPIWNLDDITLRALKILEESDAVICEDTRKTGLMLNHFQIKKKLISYHGYSDEKKEDMIIESLKKWENLALVSDAGTPGISDPGYRLIQKAIQEDIKIVPIPWASAFLTCIQASGMPINHFTYLGFLPIKKGRKTLLESLKNKEHPVVIYESVHRIEKTLKELKNYFWREHSCVVGRELTKKFEEIKRGNLGEIYKYFSQKEKQKWEFVIIF